MPDLFDDNDQEITIDPEKDYAPELIGDGKKYRDQAAAARALLEKDVFIERLKRENAGVRSDLNARMRLEEVLDKIAAPRTEEVPVTREELPNTGKPPTYSPDDVAKLVNETVERKSQETAIQQNLKQVKDRLKDTWGEDYPSKLKQLANKLDVGEAFLDDVAKKNPTAFFQLVGLNAQPTPKVQDDGMPFAPPRSRNTAGFVPQSNEKNWTYYENLRKSNPAQYWSPRVQNEIHAQAIKADKEGKDFGL